MSASIFCADRAFLASIYHSQATEKCNFFSPSFMNINEGRRQNAWMTAFRVCSSAKPERKKMKVVRKSLRFLPRPEIGRALNQNGDTEVIFYTSVFYFEFHGLNWNRKANCDSNKSLNLLFFFKMLRSYQCKLITIERWQSYHSFFVNRSTWSLASICRCKYKSREVI